MTTQITLAEVPSDRATVEITHPVAKSQYVQDLVEDAMGKVRTWLDPYSCIEQTVEVCKPRLPEHSYRINVEGVFWNFQLDKSSRESFYAKGLTFDEALENLRKAIEEAAAHARTPKQRRSAVRRSYKTKKI